MKKLRTNLGMAGVLCVMMFLIFTAIGFAQDKATLIGSVTDSDDGSPLPGANIVLVGTTIGAASSGSGNFTVGNIPPGTYTVKVSFIGYETSETADVVFSAGETITMNFSLVLTGIQFNPIVATASRRPEKALDAPASISVIEPREITQYVAPSSASILANVTGIDMATTGVDRREIVMRGFNNAFSGAAYILTDNRRAAVPSLDVNLHSIMPNMAIDLEKIEVVRGPGSALYGAGVDAGVIHYLTKSPFDYPGTTVSFSGGERSSFAGHFRHAATLTENVGFKVTGQYAQADDWDYLLSDPLDAAQVINPINGDTTFFNRDYEKINVNGNLEFRLSDNTSLIANGGYSTLKATLLSGIGTLQADGYGYTYGQLRLRSGSLFAQAYLNKNKAGDSFVYAQTQRDGQVRPVVDNSIVVNLQAQYDLELGDGKEQLIFGVDYDRISPDTEATIFGINEEDDLISEAGVYVQSRTQISNRLDLTAALRADYNNIEEDFQFSPRAALVFKPTPQHSFRATYNRAYALPGSNSLFLDIVARRTDLAPGISIIEKGVGSKNGWTFNTSTQGGVISASSVLPIPAGPLGFGTTGFLLFPNADAEIPYVPWSAVYGILYAQLSSLSNEEIAAGLKDAGFDVDPSLIPLFLNLLSPQSLVVDPLKFATTKLDMAPVNIEPLKSTITQSFEVGYKGLIGEKVLFAIDGYYTKKNNFVSGVAQISPRVVYTDFQTEFTAALDTAIQNNGSLVGLLPAVGLTTGQLAAIISGLAEDLEKLGVGVVHTDQEMTPGVILGGYRNFGNVDFWGIDAALQILASNRLSFFGNISYVSDDLFDDKELEEPGSGILLALNATKLKLKGGFNYNIPKGFSFNSAVRYTDGFPVRSGPYIGDVKSYMIWDVGAGFDFSRAASGLRLDVTVQNVLDNKHREFIGAPQIGRLALARLMYSR